MIKQFSFLVVGVCITLSVSSQAVDWSAKSEIQQLSNNLNSIQGGCNSFTDWLSMTESIQKEIQQLDSIIYYGYDEEHDEWNIKMYKIGIFYDKHFNDTTILQSTWDTTNNSWLVRAKEVKQYGENNELLSREFHLISKSANRIEYTYNDNIDLIEITESYSSSGKWQYRKRNVYSYNSKNVLQADTLYLRFTISGASVWHKVGITNFYYNTEGSVIADTTYARSWLKGNNFSDWEWYSKTDYVTKENATETTSFRWDNESNAFKPNLKKLILYHNDDKDISSLIDFKWNIELNLWDTITTMQYLYSKDDFIISYEKLTLDDSCSKVLEVFDFDYDIGNDRLLLPTSALDANPKIAFHHKINNKQSMRYNYSTHENQKFRETKYYYSTINYDPPTSVNETPHTALKLYPNPASEFITMSFSDSFDKAWLELFDLNGKKVLSKFANTGENIDISDQKGGLYIYCIRNDEQIHVGKLRIK